MYEFCSCCCSHNQLPVCESVNHEGGVGFGLRYDSCCVLHQVLGLLWLLYYAAWVTS